MGAAKVDVSSSEEPNQNVPIIRARKGSDYSRMAAPPAELTMSLEDRGKLQPPLLPLPPSSLLLLLFACCAERHISELKETDAYAAVTSRLQHQLCRRGTFLVDHLSSRGDAVSPVGCNVSCDALSCRGDAAVGEMRQALPTHARTSTLAFAALPKKLCHKQLCP